MNKTILSVENITKSYSGVTVLHNVSLDVKEGEIHALCGENGAGKSTLIKILTGAIRPDSGKITINGNDYCSLNPKLSMEKGISVIYQEFSLIPYLTVYENIFFGREVQKYGIRNRKKMRENAVSLCRELGIELDVDSRVCDLGIAYQQIVEILKAVSLNSKIMIMDEPTAPLTVKETALFFKLIRTLQTKGTTIIFISHRLEEVFELCDRATVLCDGRIILTSDIKDLTRKDLVAAMVGRVLSEDYPHSKKPISKEVVLDVSGISNKNVHDVSFELHKGEILGFGGLVGAGRTELMRILFGADSFEKGKMSLNGQNYHPHSPRLALQHGVGLIPEDRKHQGIVACLSVRNNICMGSEENLSTCGVIQSKKEIELVDKHIKGMKIKVSGQNQQVRNLSGGNQQKVVLGKILSTDCDILIFDEPTRGIDVGAKQEIYHLMVDFINQGKSIIMVSSEMPELIGMSDRILVMAGGKITGELNRTEFSQERILEMASCDNN